MNNIHVVHPAGRAKLVQICSRKIWSTATKSSQAKTPQLENMLKEKVATGMYNSVSEVVREALRLLSERDSLNATKLKALKQELHRVSIHWAKVKAGLWMLSTLKLKVGKCWLIGKINNARVDHPT